jgi:hypothetical protein
MQFFLAMLVFLVLLFPHRITTHRGNEMQTQTEMLAEAKAQQAKHRADYFALTGKAQRNAADQLEFWSNRVAFLSAVKLAD